MIIVPVRDRIRLAGVTDPSYRKARAPAIGIGDPIEDNAVLSLGNKFKRVG